MATNLKTSKKIRAFIYRILATGGLFVFVATSLMGREALSNFINEGPGTLTGDLYYLEDFREYISSVSQQAMLAYGGIGDDQGIALKNSTTTATREEIKTSLERNLTKVDEDLLYYISYILTPSVTYTNVSYPIFSASDGHLLLSDSLKLCFHWDGKNKTTSYFSQYGTSHQALHLKTSEYGNYPYKPVSAAAEKMQVVFAYKPDGNYHSSQMRDWDNTAKSYQQQLFWILGSGIFTLLFSFMSLISIKYGKESRKDFAHFSGKVFLEVKILLAFSCIWMWYRFQLGYILDSLLMRTYRMPFMLLYLPIGIILYVLWTDLRFNGYHIFLQCIPIKLAKLIKEFACGLPQQRKTLLLCIGTALGAIFSYIACITDIVIAYQLRTNWYNQFTLSPYREASEEALYTLAVLSFLLGCLLVFLFWRLYRLSGDLHRVTGKISNLHKGENSAPLQLPKRSILHKTAIELNELENGIEAAVEQRNRSNRMRVELITNVSHDLKTPLTSIINYADLLCEEPLNEPANEYARALRDKSYRLKRMVQDVFDLSKATTGNLPVEKHRLDLVKLIRQTLADMDEKISSGTLTFKLAISEEPLMIEADGDKLYRVFQNLFVNALQYSLDYSRVHIQLSAQNGYAVAKIKNTSKGELDFDTAEIIERFVRSDASRTTEGSGLGLSIVQSFTESCGGTFTIETDADMFTAMVSFPLAQEKPICETDEIKNSQLNQQTSPLETETTPNLDSSESAPLDARE